jgi:hypothetical protein
MQCIDSIIKIRYAKHALIIKIRCVNHALMTDF